MSVIGLIFLILAGLANLVGLDNVGFFLGLGFLLFGALLAGQLFVGIIIGAFGKFVVPTSTLPTTAKSALQVLMVLLGLSGAIIVFLTTGHT